MAVVQFPMDLAPQGPEASQSWELRSLSAMNRSPLNAVATSLERAGAHFAVRLPYQNLAESRRARLQTFATAHRGSANRFHVPVFGWTRRGSFPATELLTNNTFASGTAGWSATSVAGATPVLTASDGLLRVTDTGSANAPQVQQAVTLVQYAPYAARGILHPGRGVTAALLQTFIGAGALSGQATSPAPAVFVPAATSGSVALFNNVTTSLAGNFFEASFASAARCALVDNGPNFFQRSDEIDNAYWTKGNCTTLTNNQTAPDGIATGEAVVEDATAGVQHQFFRAETRTSQAEDWCGYGYFKRAAGTRNIRLIIGRDGSNFAHATFDLGNGTIIDGPTVSGDATNARAFIVPAGNGWYYCAVVGRLTATTSVLLYINMASGTDIVYNGDGTSAIGAWRVGAAQSSVATRGMQTTSAGDADGVAQTGGALYLKGLPASTSGLLLQGDPAEIITGTTSQLVRTRSSLDSDAAGLGYWQFEPPLRVSPSDNAGVIIQNPLCKMMMENSVAGWTDRLGGFTDLEFAAVEDTYPS